MFAGDVTKTDIEDIILGEIDVEFYDYIDVQVDDDFTPHIFILTPDSIDVEIETVDIHDKDGEIIGCYFNVIWNQYPVDFDLLRSPDAARVYYTQCVKLAELAEIIATLDIYWDRYFD